MLRRRRAAEWPGRDIWGERAQKNDRKLQHHGWEQRGQHGEILKMPVCVCDDEESQTHSSADFFQVLGLKLPNVLGRAEKLTFQFSYGTKETSYGLSFFKPQPGHFERKYDFSMGAKSSCC